MPLADALSLVLAPGPAVELADVSAWWPLHLEAVRTHARPFDAALAVAARSDRLAFAFGSGYASALRALVPALPAGSAACLAATEERGGHPRAIESTLAVDGDGFRLTGKKRWITLGPRGATFLVVARTGEEIEGRPVLRLVRVPSERAGVVVHPMPPTPFVPELPHATLSLEGVRVEAEDVLPGDGYADYLKPFRTVEDVHVVGAALAWVTATGARAGWPDAVLQRLAALVALARELAEAPPSRAEVHVALAGLLDGAASVQETAPWDLVDAATRERWARDRALLRVAQTAREARRAKAWETLRSPAGER